LNKIATATDIKTYGNYGKLTNPRTE